MSEVTPHDVVGKWLAVQYPDILNDCIEYTLNRNGNGEVLVTLQLVYNASKLNVTGERGD